MPIVDDYGLDVASRKLPLIVLSLYKDLDDRDILKINKTLKLYQEIGNTDEIEFSNYNLGSVSYDIEENMVYMVEIGLVEKIGKNKYQLTEFGKRAIEELYYTLSNNDIKIMKECVLILQGLSFEELLYYMYRRFPDTQVNSTKFDELEKKKLRIIRSLVSKGKLNSKQAAEWLK